MSAASRPAPGRSAGVQRTKPPGVAEEPAPRRAERYANRAARFLLSTAGPLFWVVMVSAAVVGEPRLAGGPALALPLPRGDATIGVA